MVVRNHAASAGVAAVERIGYLQNFTYIIIIIYLYVYSADEQQRRLTFPLVPRNAHKSIIMSIAETGDMKCVHWV